MPYSSPASQSTGTVAPVSWANAVKAGLDYLANPPACRVYNNAVQSLANATETALTFNSERWDTDAMHSTSVNTSRITFNTAGLYVISGHVSFAGNVTGHREVQIKLNAATYLAVLNVPAVAAVSNPYISIATTYKFAVADYVELRCYQNSGGALNTAVLAATSPEFTATWVGLG